MIRSLLFSIEKSIKYQLQLSVLHAENKGDLRLEMKTKYIETHQVSHEKKLYQYTIQNLSIKSQV